MEIKSMKVADLKFDPRNARKHPQNNLDALAESLRMFGQRKPIVVSQDGTVVAGNGTLQAAISIGWKELDVVQVPADWDAKKVAAFALADNRTAELATWDARELLDQLENLDDFDMNALGFDAWNAKLDERPAGEEAPESRGLGTPIISFEIIFDDHEQQNVWFEFLKMARMLHPDAETNAERITETLRELIVEDK
jgi:hypothetical protein